jgi:hypothetical protein
MLCFIAFSASRFNWGYYRIVFRPRTGYNENDQGKEKKWMKWVAVREGMGGYLFVLIKKTDRMTMTILVHRLHIFL